VPVNYLGDFGGGSMFLALGLVSGVLAARASGRGRVVDAAIVDGAVRRRRRATVRRGGAAGLSAAAPSR
jgi:crotonobetainyl-CoA:carnitine CoA-transferase CaiB-like acyl-CoA transferase